MISLLKGLVNRKKPGPLELGEGEVEAFRTLYAAFVEALVLVYYNPTIVTKVEIDASNFACSGILSQL